MATVVREIERKYDPAAGATAALDAVRAMAGTAGIAGVSQQDDQCLDAVYYDTADLRLTGAGITLRRRTGGGDAGWHLKLPAGAGTRDEIRLPLDAAGRRRAATPHARAGAVPEQLAAWVRAWTRGAELAPVALQAFGGIIDREPARPLCAELKWLAAARRDRTTGH